MDEDFEVLNGFQQTDAKEENINKSSNRQDNLAKNSLDFIFLVTSEATHFKHRNAIRSTWGKLIAKYNSKVLFFIGNPFYNLTMRNVRIDGNHKMVYIARSNQIVSLGFSVDDKNKLEAEMQEHGDVVQIDISDNENFTIAKTLVSLRWAFTFCTEAQKMFVLSDLAVLNVKQFEKLFKDKDFMATKEKPGVIKGSLVFL